jgi:endonuclease YncB( thermonuclease family)
LVNRTASGAPTGFEPDGDSIHFRPADPALLDRLRVLARPYRLSAIGSVQLRLEGLDALEIHYSPDGGGPVVPPAGAPRRAGARLPDRLLGMNPVPYAPPRNVRVRPPVPVDATPGYIVSRSLEINGRPVSFAFAGEPPVPDGTEVILTVEEMRRSLNYQLLRAGHAYPLFYDTLFYDLRNEMARAVRQARRYKRGLWPQDRSADGISVARQSDLEQSGVIFPKLFRRLTDFLAQTRNDPGRAGLAGFAPWLERTREQVLDIPLVHFTHFDNRVEIAGDTVRLALPPEEMVFISAK